MLSARFWFDSSANQIEDRTTVVKTQVEAGPRWVGIKSRPSLERWNTMKTYFHILMLMTVAAVTVLLQSSLVHAQWDAASLRGDFGAHRRPNSNTSSTHRSTAPVIVRSAPDPAAVAQKPTTERAYSYEPSTQAGASTACGGNAAAAPAPSTARKTTSSNRSFSYEPGANYSGPAVRHSSGASRGELSYEKAMRSKGY